jgi:hypothetical protein
MRNSLLTMAYRGLFRHADWNIGVAHAPIGAFLQPNARPLVSWFPPTKRGKFLADPFAVVRDGTTYILCEEFDYAANKGRIVSFELTDWLHPSGPKVAIELPTHISYPYLIEYQGAIYCTPETHQAREIALYKAEEFPHQWIRIASLISDFSGLDATIFQYEGRWWLTCACKDADLAQLFVWYAWDLLGPWTPHAGNPVKTDIRSSRPAGTPFMHDGYLHRPAQDCSRSYGGGIVLNRVTRLTPTEFEEEPVTVIEPYENGPYRDGIHTVSAAGDVTIIDGLRRRFASSALRRNVAQILDQTKVSIQH